MGGRVQAGLRPRATNPFGYRSVQDMVRVPDLHATLLHALGFDHERLTYPHEGRDDSLTDVGVTHAEVVPALLR